LSTTPGVGVGVELMWYYWTTSRPSTLAKEGTNRWGTLPQYHTDISLLVFWTVNQNTGTLSQGSDLLDIVDWTCEYVCTQSPNTPCHKSVGKAHTHTQRSWIKSVNICFKLQKPELIGWLIEENPVHLFWWSQGRRKKNKTTEIVKRSSKPHQSANPTTHTETRISSGPMR
jgi:hypothetical protein